MSCTAPTRRQALNLFALSLATTLLPSAAPAASGRQVVNGVLSAYGLPQLKDVEGFTPLLEQYARLVIEFQYPSAWIVARNVIASSDRNSADIAQSTGGLSFGTSSEPMSGRTASLTAGDYRKAEGVSFFTSDGLPEGVADVKDLPAKFIMDLVTPGDAAGSSPEYKILKDVLVPETGYRMIQVKFESTTVSGYTVERRMVASAAVLNDRKLYALAGSCSENRVKKIFDKLLASVGTFRAYRL